MNKEGNDVVPGVVRYFVRITRDIMTSKCEQEAVKEDGVVLYSIDIEPIQLL